MTSPAPATSSSPGASSELHKTPLHAYHLERGAKMVPFAGWEMPLHYGSIIEEHNQVRQSGGIFDVSHMGRFSFSGRDARAFLDHVCTRQIAGMQHGHVRYSVVCNEHGGCHDDVLVYCVNDDEYHMVCNASNREKLLAHFAAVKGDHVFKFEDTTLSSAMVAVQGPKVMELIGKYSNSVPALKRYRFLRQNIFGLNVIISRTGYTGEDGVEVIFSTKNIVAKTAMKMILKDLTAVEGIIKPAGLGARDSLRLEAGMALYGHELSEDLDPVSASLDFALKLTKGDDDPSVGTFIGQAALRAIADRGPERRLSGLVLATRREARQLMPVLRDGSAIGVVTSGVQSPTLLKSVAMAYLDSAHAAVGTAVQIDLGRQTVDAEVVPLPFYKAD